MLLMRAYDRDTETEPKKTYLPNLAVMLVWLGMLAPIVGELFTLLAGAVPRAINKARACTALSVLLALLAASYASAHAAEMNSTETWMAEIEGTRLKDTPAPSSFISEALVKKCKTIHQFRLGCCRRERVRVVLRLRNEPICD